MKTFTRLFAALIILISSVFLTKAQNDTLPLYLTKKYIKGEFKSDKSILTDMAIEKDFPIKKITKNAITTYEELYCNQSEAMVTVSVMQGQKNKNIYVYWLKDKSWKIKSFRTLRMPGVFYVILEKYKDLEDDGISAEYKKTVQDIKRKNPEVTDDEITESLGSLDELLLNIKIMRQAVSPDSALIAYFNNNIDKFNKLLTNISQQTKNSEPWKYDNKSLFGAEMQEILISSISNFENKNLVSFVITQIIDNSVGYFYCQNPSDVPKMEENHFILIRPVGENWYLYKKI